MGSPRGNDPHNVTPYGEGDEKRISGHLADRLAPFFSILAPPVYALQAALVRKHKRGMGKIKTAFAERQAAFRFIPFEYHMGGSAV
jgi:hypothetical protein